MCSLKVWTRDWRVSIGVDPFCKDCIHHEISLLWRCDFLFLDKALTNHRIYHISACKLYRWPPNTIIFGHFQACVDGLWMHILHMEGVDKSVIILQSVLATGDSRAAKLLICFFEGNLMDDNQRTCEANTAVSRRYSSHFFHPTFYLHRIVQLHLAFPCFFSSDDYYDIRYSSYTAKTSKQNKYIRCPKSNQFKS